MNQNTLKSIHIKQITIQDKSKVFVFPTNIEGAKEKITKWNAEIIYKPILLEKINNNLYRPLAEIDTLLFLEQHKVKYINSIVIDGTELDIFIQSIIEIKNSKRLNLIEKAIIIEKLVNQFKVTDIEKYLPLIDEEKHNERLKNILKLNKLITPLKIFVAKEKPNLQIAYAISSLKEKEQVTLCNIINKLKLNKNKIKKIIEDIFHIEKKKYQTENNTKEKVLILLNNIIDKYQNKTEKQLQSMIEQELNKIKYPLFQKEMELIKETIKNFKLPPKCKIILPKNFEGKGIILSLNAKNLEEYNIAIDKLHLIKENKQINELFRLYSP